MAACVGIHHQAVRRVALGAHLVQVGEAGPVPSPVVVSGGRARGWLVLGLSLLLLRAGGSPGGLSGPAAEGSRVRSCTHRGQPGTQR